MGLKFLSKSLLVLNYYNMWKFCDDDEIGMEADETDLVVVNTCLVRC